MRVSHVALCDISSVCSTYINCIEIITQVQTTLSLIFVMAGQCFRVIILLFIMQQEHMYRPSMHWLDAVINACAARVTVVVLCVCLFVCRRLFSHYRLRGGL